MGARAATRRDAPRTRSRPRSRGAALLLVVGLALAGLVATVVLLATAAPPPLSAEVGQPVTLPSGTLTVTRVGTTFVPATQGPPSQEKMMGTVGTHQLQVWVELSGRDEAGLAYAPEHFTLGGEGRQPVPPDGASLGEGVLPRHSAVSGQVWFDTVESLDGAWLEYAGPRGRPVRVALEDAVGPLPEDPHGH